MILLLGCGRYGFDPVPVDASQTCAGELCEIVCADHCSCESPACIVRCAAACEVSDCEIDHCTVLCANNRLATYDGTSATCPM